MEAESHAPDDPVSTVATIDANASPRAAGRSRPGRQRLLLAVLIASVVGIGIKPTYEYWLQRRTAFYRSACKRAVQSRAWPQLEALAAAWLAWDPDSDEGLLFSAEAAEQSGRREDAVKSLARIHDDFHGVLPALSIQADMLFSDLNRPYDAVETWQRMLRINPHADIARQRLIYFYAMTMQREKMLDGIYRAMELGCEPPEAYAYLLLAYEVTFSDGLRLTKEWLRTYPDDVALKVAHSVYLARYSPEKTINIYGMSLISAGDETLVNEYLPQYPANLELLAFYLDKATLAGDQERVFELLSQCPADAERDARFWRFRGWYLASQDRFAEAEQALQKALELHPYDWRARMLRAGILRRLDRPEEGSAQARIANLGKDLQRDLMQLPNARSLNPAIALRIDEYLQLTAPPLVQRAWEIRRQ